MLDFLYGSYLPKRDGILGCASVESEYLLFFSESCTVESPSDPYGRAFQMCERVLYAYNPEYFETSQPP